MGESVVERMDVRVNGLLDGGVWWMDRWMNAWMETRLKKNAI